MGRKPIPDGIKKARGTLQKCRETESADVELLDSVKAPSWLNTKAKKIFRDKAVMLMAYRVQSALERDQLAIYAAKMQEIEECQKNITESGHVSTVYDDEGHVAGFVENPYIKIMKEDIKVVTHIGSNFGFSPADRKVLAASAQKDDRDEFTDYEEVR